MTPSAGAKIRWGQMLTQCKCPPMSPPTAYPTECQRMTAEVRAGYLQRHTGLCLVISTRKKLKSAAAGRKPRNGLGSALTETASHCCWVDIRNLVVFASASQVAELAYLRLHSDLCSGSLSNGSVMNVVCFEWSVLSGLLWAGLFWTVTLYSILRPAWHGRPAGSAPAYPGVADVHKLLRHAKAIVRKHRRSWQNGIETNAANLNGPNAQSVLQGRLW